MVSVASAGSSTPSPLCGVHLFGGNKDFVDACIWDDFLVTAAVLERSTSASRLFVMIPENASFCVSRLSDRGYWGKPPNWLDILESVTTL